MSSLAEEPKGAAAAALLSMPFWCTRLQCARESFWLKEMEGKVSYRRRDRGKGMGMCVGHGKRKQFA